MKPHACLVALVVAILALASPGVLALPAPFVGTATSTVTSTYFAADVAPADPAVELVRTARQRVLVAGYDSVPPALAAALRDARLRGVAVRVVLDRSGRQMRMRYSGTAFLAEAGIGFASTSRPGLMRQPFVVVDDAVAIGAPAGLTGNADAVRAGGPMRGLNVFRGVPQFAQTYTHAFWRLYRLAGGR
ncbi:hypothetical protein GIY62_16675 [Burkholderia plantarii]|uniref:hypothetical protein n=1 Tax=Burkholderia plantarii TaxID=41899 RepID=UPI00272AF9FE|nr:hypothetical protein [Burkholderia plantarii]WLE58734.1 hypothetical protein GIY62_16675 [Burkholderia plantarii]